MPEVTHAELEKLDSRVGKLESQTFLKILMPGAIALIGTLLTAYFGWQATQLKAEIDRSSTALRRFEVAEKFLPDIFSGDLRKAVAAQRMVVVVVPEFGSVIDSLLREAFAQQIVNSSRAGASDEAYQILADANAVAPTLSRALGESARKAGIDPNRASGYAQATDSERRGFEQILAGDREGALRSFQAAERAYPGLHNVSEISRVLRESPGIAPSQPESRRETLARIVSQYSWKAPPQALMQMRQEIGRPAKVLP